MPTTENITVLFTDLVGWTGLGEELDPEPLQQFLERYYETCVTTVERNGGIDAFLLATPVILAAGVLEIPKLLGPLGHGIHGQILLGSVLSGVGAYVSVRFLVKYFQTRTLTPFAIYCVVFGLGCAIYLGVVK